MDPFDGLPEPVLKAWQRSAASGRAALSRRSLLRAAGLGAVAAGALTGCGIPAASQSSGGGATSEDHSTEEKVVNFSNWPLYIDVDDKDKNRRPTLDSFTKATGIKVNYTEDIEDNDDFFGKIQAQLRAGQDTGRDLVVLTDWMAARIIRLGWAEVLDQSRLPHAFANLAQQYRSPDWDPGRAHSYPWAGIATLIAYNKKATGGKAVTSVSQLLTDPSLKGSVTMLTEMRDTIGLTLLDMGKDPAKVTQDDYNAAIARVQKAVDSHQIRAFTGNEYAKDLASGNIKACLAWAGDLVQLKADNPDIEYVIPETGYMASTDNMLIPRRARHKANAERLMDWYYRPEIAAELADYVNYFTPVEGAAAALAKIDPDAAKNPLIIADSTMAAKGHAFRALSETEEATYQAAFAKLIGA
ncbi:spermidine/putrescine ABC transporter substrate-binding protein [Peterkaempfera sp. SMS 1(5)a]|uniref:polyamine ABC transporter substrate-binding protein n=1 Tax=Peterkaempfera podocarpi TaxID=3232308 RepID=UPI00366D3474